MNFSSENELAALLGSSSSSMGKGSHQSSQDAPFDVLPRLQHHNAEVAQLDQSLHLEPSMIIDVRQSARVYEVYHKLDDRWRANLTRQALNTPAPQASVVPSATFAAEERFLYFAKRLDIDVSSIQDLLGMSNQHLREALRIGSTHRPAYHRQLKHVCAAILDKVDEKLSHDHKKPGASLNVAQLKNFKKTVETFQKDLCSCVEVLNDVVETAYLMRLSHIAQLKALDIKYQDAFASAGAIAKSAHKQTLRGWAKGIVEILMAWSDRLAPFVTLLHAHTMRLAAFVQGTINILHYHEVHLSEEAARGVAVKSSPLSLESLRYSLRMWAGFMAAVGEVAKATNTREPCDRADTRDIVEALQAALLQENPNPSDLCTDAFVSMRYFLSGKSLVAPIRAVTERISAAAAELGPALNKFKSETELLFRRYSAETLKQERLVTELERKMRVNLDEATFHSGQTSRHGHFSHTAIELNIALMTRIEELRPELAREVSTLKELRDSFSIMADLHRSCQDALPVAQFDKLEAAERSIVEELVRVSKHVQAGFESVNGQALISARASSSTLFDDAGRDSKALASQRDQVLEMEVIRKLHARITYNLPWLRDLQKNIGQWCRMDSDFVKLQSQLAEVDLNVEIGNDIAMRLNLIIAMHIYEYALEVSSEKR